MKDKKRDKLIRDMDLDRVEMIKRVDKALKMVEDQINVINAEEKVIIDYIKDVLDERCVEYSYDESNPKTIYVSRVNDNKPFSMEIFHQYGKIVLKLDFPFRVQTNAIAITSLYINEYNERKAFSMLNMKAQTGELYMLYSYVVEHIGDFDTQAFFIYFISIIQAAEDVYAKLAHLAVGKIQGIQKSVYRQLLEHAMSVLFDMDDDDDEVTFGSLEIESAEKRNAEFTDKMVREFIPELDDDWDIYQYDELDEDTKRKLPSFEDVVKIEHEVKRHAKEGTDDDGDVNEIIFE